MIPIFNSNKKFACYGFRVRSDAEYLVVPDVPDAQMDALGVELRTLKRSETYGYRLCAPSSSSSSSFFEIKKPISSIRVCVVGNVENPMTVLGFSHWKIVQQTKSMIMFVQYGDPRLNGAPVVDRSTGELIGMYLVTNWNDETKAECVPSDLFTRTAIEGWDPRRKDVAYEIVKGWDINENASFLRVPRAIEIDGDWVFYETFDGRAKWATHVYPDREFIDADECVYLFDSFKSIVRALESHQTQFKWIGSSGSIRVQNEARGLGFDLSYVDVDVKDVNDTENEYPCVDWDFPA
jgi:hypothetical protein